MKNRPRFVLLIPVLALAALAVVLPSSASAALVCDNGGYTSVTLKGTGPDCSSAEFDLAYLLGHAASDDCMTRTGMSACNFSDTITRACELKASGNYTVKGYATYGCVTDNMPPAPSH